jgi:hypothetical protein
MNSPIGIDNKNKRQVHEKKEDDQSIDFIKIHWVLKNILPSI